MQSQSYFSGVMIRPGVLLRVISNAAIVWLVLAIIWMTLPSPPIKNGPDIYVTKRLKAGKNLVRVYQVEDFFPYADPTIAVRAARRTDRLSFALDYKLDISSKTLHVSDTEISLEVPEQALHITEPISVVARTGDHDGINPPWFWPADATLLYWWIHRDDAVVPIRLRWTAKYAVELWPDSQEWLSSSSKPPKDLQPLLTIENIYDEDPEQFRAFVPKFPISCSPSRTYPIRVALLAIIAPTGLLVYSIFSALGSLLSVDIFWLIIVVVPVVLWYAKAKPRFDELRVPEYLQNMHYADNDPLESAADRERRRFSWSWNWLITTRSPLDDILRSFDTTRHLTRPLSFRRPSTDDPGAEDDSALSDVDSERTLRADDEVPQKDEDRGNQLRADADLEKGQP